MKKILFIIAIILISHPAETPVQRPSLVTGTPIRKSPPLVKKETQPSLVFLAPMPTPPLVRAPAQIQGTLSTERPLRLEHLVERNDEVTSPTGEWIAKNISALPSPLYSPSMGKEIYKDPKFTYFEGKTEESVVAAFDPITQRFYPVSQVLLLKKISEDLRREITDEGHKEYYYNSRLSILSIQSTPQEVLSLYNEFKNRGLDVRIEVLRESPQVR